MCESQKEKEPDMMFVYILLSHKWLCLPRYSQRRVFFWHNFMSICLLLVNSHLCL